MERGNEGSKGRLEAVEFKIKKKEDELLELNNIIKSLKTEIVSKKIEDLIVKESDFLGFKKVKTDRTIENYEKTFKAYNIQIIEYNKNLQIRKN